MTRGDLAERLLLTGELRAEQAIELRVPRTRQWQLPIRWMVDDGAAVEEGDRVAEFDNSAFVRDLEDRRLRIRQSELELASLAASGAMTVADKEFELEKQRALLERAELLAGVPADLLTMREFQERQLARERARSAVARAEEDLAAHRRTSALDLDIKRIDIEKLKREVEAAEEAIAALTLTAPRAGIALVSDHPFERRRLVVGDAGQPGWSVVSIPDLSRMRVEAFLSDVDDGRIAAGMRVEATLDAYPDDRLAGTVHEVTAVAHELGRRSLRRAFHIAVNLDQTDPERMRPGMSVKVEVRGPALEGVLLVPRAALDLRGDEPAALLAGGGRAPVRLGPCDAHRCVVEDGVVEGQRLSMGAAR